MCNKLRKLLKSKIKLNSEIIEDNNKENLLNQKKKKHLFNIEKDYRLQCPFNNCGKKFKIRGNLNIHIRTHTGERFFKCPFDNCGKSFITKGNLKSHVSIHTGEKFYTCDFSGCSKRYSHLCRLNIHKRTHTGEKPFACPNCEKTFNEKGNLVTHFRIHTGEKPYKCNFKNCIRSFKAKSHLKDHQKIHLNYKPFECETCHDKFSRYSTLKIHKLIHTGEKPHICPHPICLKRFADKGNMKNHFKLHFKNQSKEKIKENFAKFNKYMREKNSISSVDITDIFWNKSSPDKFENTTENFDNKLYFEKSLINNDFAEDILIRNKSRDYTTNLELFPNESNLSRSVDICNWNELFNISSNFSSTEEGNVIPNYFNMFIEKNY